jgi:N-acetyltransferase
MMSPPMQPHLRDDRVELRPMRADDFDALFAVAQDKQIWAIHPAHDRWQEPVFRAFFDEGLASRGALTVIDRANGAAIGSSRYDIRVCEPGEVEIGWTYLARSHWGGATNRSMKRLMLAHAFDTGFEAVIFLVGETNLRSRRALEKIGATLTDRRQDWPMADGVVSHLIYRIDRAAFESGPLS